MIMVCTEKRQKMIDRDIIKRKKYLLSFLLKTAKHIRINEQYY